MTGLFISQRLIMLQRKAIKTCPSIYLTTNHCIVGELADPLMLYMQGISATSFRNTSTLSSMLTSNLAQTVHTHTHTESQSTTRLTSLKQTARRMM